MGFSAIQKFGHSLPNQTKESLAKKDGWIMGPHDSTAYPNVLKKKEIQVMNYVIILIYLRI